MQILCISKKNKTSRLTERMYKMNLKTFAVGDKINVIFCFWIQKELKKKTFHIFGIKISKNIYSQIRLEGKRVEIKVNLYFIRMKRNIVCNFFIPDSAVNLVPKKIMKSNFWNLSK